MVNRAMPTSRPRGRRSRAFALATIAIVGGALGAACNGLAGIEPATLAVPDAPVTSDASGEVVVEAGDPNVCTSGQWPPLPTSAVAGGSIAFDAAVHTVGISLSSPGSLPLGYNLDATCTCPGPESCVGAVGKQHCDDSSGRDTSLNAAVFDVLTAIPGFSESSLNDAIAKGQWSVLIEISDWNGLPDDAQVTAALKLSPGIHDKTKPPTWEGADTWDVDTASVDAITGAPLVVDHAAYVTGGTFVSTRADGARLDLLINGENFSVKFQQTVITARILSLGGASGDAGADADADADATSGPTLDAAGDGGSGAAPYQLVDGMIAGRWATADALQAIGGLPDPISTGKLLCDPTSALGSTAVSLICDNADLPVDSSLDRTGAPCTAISFAVRFTAVSAREGVVRSNGIAPITCSHTVADCAH